MDGVQFRFNIQHPLDTFCDTTMCQLPNDNILSNSVLMKMMYITRCLQSSKPCANTSVTPTHVVCTSLIATEKACTAKQPNTIRAFFNTSHWYCRYIRRGKVVKFKHIVYRIPDVH